METQRRLGNRSRAWVKQVQIRSGGRHQWVKELDSNGSGFSGIWHVCLPYISHSRWSIKCRLVSRLHNSVRYWLIFKIISLAYSSAMKWPLKVTPHLKCFATVRYSVKFQYLKADIGYESGTTCRLMWHLLSRRLHSASGWKPISFRNHSPAIS